METRSEKRKRILSVDSLRSLFSYDPESGKLTWKKWLPGFVAGTNIDSALKVTIERLDFKAHRLAWTIYYGLELPDDKVIDHINGNPLDNRIVNLRICDQVHNSRNCALPKNSTTGFKGVSHMSRFNTYRAYICVNYKQLHLGVFKSAEDAAIAYNKAALEHFGEYARLNAVTKAYLQAPTP